MKNLTPFFVKLLVSLTSVQLQLQLRKKNVTAHERSAKACVEPAITWCLRKFNVDLWDVVVVLKAVRLFYPVRI